MTSTAEKCDNKIYSDFTYEKAREENLRRVSQYYEKILGDYTQTYNKYLSSTTGNEPVSTPVPTGVSENWADIPTPTPVLDMEPAMEADQADMAEAVLRPKLVDLNKQLILVQKHLLENNQKVKNTIIEQKKIIASDEAEIRRKEKLLKELNGAIGRAKDQSKLGETRIEDEKNKISSTGFKYWFWAITVILLFGTNVALYMSVPSEYQSSRSNLSNNSNQSSRTSNNNKSNNNNNKNK
jgi:hypothetical protein